MFRSLLLARLGDEKAAVQAQEQALTELPAALPRFATHLELHRGLMLSRSGDKAGGITYATTAMDALPPEKHSLTLRMLLEEIKREPALATTAAGRICAAERGRTRLSPAWHRLHGHPLPHDLGAVCPTEQGQHIEDRAGPAPR